MKEIIRRKGKSVSVLEDQTDLPKNAMGRVMKEVLRQEKPYLVKSPAHRAGL